ncbi:MAG: hypothetical protein WCP21_14865 [Armatimonadota bacterium]
MSETRDVQIIRDLTQQYLDLCAKPVYDERRQLWRAHNSLQPTRPLVIIHYGMWNVWCREFFGDQILQCEDPLFREQERNLRMNLWHDSVGDDWILEPWLTQGAAVKHGGSWTGVWGVENAELERSDDEGGSFRNVKPPLQSWEDVAKMRAPRHEIDEAATAQAVGRLQDAVGDLIAIDVNRGPLLSGFMGDISTCLAYLRGLQQLMVDMYESPAQLKELLAFMRDGILLNQQQAEEAGDFSLTNHSNQAMPYALDLEDPVANSGPRRRKELWGFFAAQEYTLISPQFHDEFLYQYQLPIMSHFGLTHYGCCEDLTRKIDMLRQAPNLRSIAVTPVADVVASAEQIGTDYVYSWRPNPTDMVAHSWDEGRVRRIIGEGLRATQGCRVHVHLKDIETVGGDPQRLAQWVAVVRDEIEKLP